jgi:ferritin-like metal-binding protein YciE
MPAQPAESKLSQYLNEAQATEQALIQTLTAHIAMTPAGSYREALEGHLEETREHSSSVAERLREIGPDPGLAGVAVWAAERGVGLAGSVAGRLFAVWKAPIDMLRGGSGEEKLLKNAKDECASEALEIATYEALERLAEAVGDSETARLARRIRADEERMLARLRHEIPTLAAAVVGAEVEGRGTYRLDRTGAADTARKAAKRTVRSGRRATRAAAAEAEKAGEEAAATVGAAGQAAATATGSAGEVRETSQRTARTARATRGRASGEGRRRSRRDGERDGGSSPAPTRGSSGRRRPAAQGEPSPGSDQQTVPEVRQGLTEGNEQTAAVVLESEREHKDRTSVEQAAERQVTDNG